MASDLSRFTLNVEADPNADNDERTDLVRRLRKELSALSEIEALESPSITVPSGSKAIGIDWQTLVVTLAASGGVLTTLIGTVQAWLTRHERTSVTLEIGGDKLRITGVSSEAERQLVSNWISRHKH